MVWFVVIGALAWVFVAVAVSLVLGPVLARADRLQREAVSSRWDSSEIIDRDIVGS